MPDRPAPSQLGRFRIDSLIGRGGMGSVYKAFDPKLGRLVALKTLTLDGERQPELAERLHREARACADLHHPGIVTVHDVDEADGVVFIVMELVEGRSLSQAIADPHLTLATRLDVLMQILDALAYAHGRDIIHRDIKPSNVQLLPDNRTAKLLDFGLARLPRVEALTVEGTLMGTPHYMSPEQLRTEPLDATTDVYSTGVLAYELLTGQRPFDGETITEVILKVTGERPPAMNAEWQGTFPEIETIVNRAMAKTPRDRFASANEMRNAIGQFIAEHRADFPTIVVRDTVGPTASDGVSSVPRSNGAPPIDSAAFTIPARPAAAFGQVSTPSPEMLHDALSGQNDPNRADQAKTPSRRLLSAKAALFAAVAAVVLAIAFFQTRGQSTPAPGGAETPSASSRSNPSDQLERSGVATGVAPSANAEQGAPPHDTANGTSGTVADKTKEKPGVASSDQTGTGRVVSHPPAAPTSAKTLFLARSPSPEPAGGGTSAGQKASAASGDTDGQNPGLKYRIIRKLPSGEEVPASPDTVFRSGDRVRFSFESNVAGYLYVLQQGSTGRWTSLFPNPTINGGRNVVEQWQDYAVPSDRFFLFDEHPGIERVFVLMSKQPQEALPGFNQPVKQFATIDADVVDKLGASLTARDLVLENDTAGDDPTMASYVVNASQSGQMVVVTITLTHR